MAEFSNNSKKYKEQMAKVFNCFFERPKTMLEVSLETGILRANICRYVAKMEDDGRIQIHHKGLDRNTKCRAAFYTTNPELFTAPQTVPVNTQMSIFSDM